MSSQPFEAGLYESIVTPDLRATVERSGLNPTLTDVDKADAPDVLARHLAAALRRSLPADPSQRVSVMRRLLQDLELESEAPVDPLQQLTRLAPPAVPGVTPVTDIRPSTPLAEAALLTNAPGEPNLGHELRAEIASADRIELLCAFVQWRGLVILQDALADARDRGVPIRVVTTTYIGGTERAALDRLIEEFGAEVRVQYDARATRLHAKAWLFRRRTGFDTAYVGSSNLSTSALVTGTEWNVRLSSVTTGHLLDKFEATFDSYWNSEQFEPYRGRETEDVQRLDRALNDARGRNTIGSHESPISGLEVRPFPYQAAILERLAAERALHDRHQNLLVAATGTGKTVMAALDYKSLCEGRNRPSLLFVAHRREILLQSRRTYREVLNDGTFGELYVGGEQPQKWKHVFASVQSLTSYGPENIPDDAFDMVVVDEFHHAEAATYKRLLEHLRPKELLGLTATPERGDGLDVRTFFGGHITAELRVWDAIQQGLLSPFHYFGVSDGVDLSHVSWRQGRYAPDELENLYSGNHARARLILQQVRDKIIDPHSMRALGFCVTVRHADFMADFFNTAGIPSAALNGSSSPDERDEAISRLKRGELSAIFSVDIFNEGVDIPELDTVLLLRPTESPTVFLQQLGRGLRLAEGKDVLTVLDFVGLHRKEFRLDLRFRALTGRKGAELEHQVDEGFPLLPSGCQIVLDEVAQKLVLGNLRSNLQMRWPQLVNELRAEPTSSLEDFLASNQLELSQVVRSATKRSWTHLQADAGLIEQPSAVETELLKRVRALAHVDDPARAQAYRDLLRAGIDVGRESFAEMLFYSIFPRGGGFSSVAEGLATLRENHRVSSELSQVISYAFEGAGHLTQTFTDLDIPLMVHASYTREEILAGLGYASQARTPNNFREGVLSTSVSGAPVDAFFVTLKKSETDYSPTTLYRDYPISRTLFHWESQSTTSVNSATGQRYLTGGSIPLLFVRQQKETEFGKGAPYVFLGRTSYVSHTGDRPIAITWRLSTPMPADLFAETSITA